MAKFNRTWRERDSVKHEVTVSFKGPNGSRKLANRPKIARKPQYGVAKPR